MVGNPARRIGWMCACGERLTNDLLCPACSATYTKRGNSLVEVAPVEPVERIPKF
jgi:UDP-2-acetamido-3-amino-2,3-dideoxy-glucuronate N-acetyltransferase